MSILGGTLARYFGLRFLSAVLLVFVGIFALVALLDYVELMRRTSDIPFVSALLVAKTSFYRVPQVTEQFLAFCVLIAAMSCYLNLSRRLELVVARAAGMSAWQFISPALVVALGCKSAMLTSSAGVRYRTVALPIDPRRHDGKRLDTHPSIIWDR